MTLYYTGIGLCLFVEFTIYRDVIPNFCKNADFRLFDNPARMGRKCILRGFYPQKRQGNIAKRRFGGLRRRFNFTLSFKEGRFL